MAYLISDMAEGSKAALQMQQNFAAAPDVQQAQTNFMQEQQLKLQQEQAAVEKNRLNSMIAESGFKATQDSKFKLQALTNSSEWKAADDAQRLRMSASVQMEAGDIEGGAKTLAASEIFEAKKLTAEQNRLNQQAQVIGNAYGVIDAMPDDQVDAFVNRLPKPQQDALISQVGRENWEAMNGTQKKEATRNLMMNAKGQLAQLKFEADEKKQKAINDSREKIAQIAANWHTAVAAAGIVNKSGATTKDDVAQTRLFFQQQNTADRANKSRRLELDTAVNDAKTQVDKDRLFGNLFGAETEAKTKLDRAIAARTAFEVEAATKAFDSASLLPDGATKTRILAEIKRQVAALGVNTPDTEDVDNSEPKASGDKITNAPPAKSSAAPTTAAPVATPAPAAAAAVPSNTTAPATAPAAATTAAPVVLKAPPNASEAQVATVVAAQKAIDGNPAKAPLVIEALKAKGIPFEIAARARPSVVTPDTSVKPTAAATPPKLRPTISEETRVFNNLEPQIMPNGDVVVKNKGASVTVGKVDNQKDIKGAQDLITKWISDQKMANTPTTAVAKKPPNQEGKENDTQVLANLKPNQQTAAQRFINLYQKQGGKTSTTAEYNQAMKDRKVIEALSDDQQAAISRLAKTVTPIAAPTTTAANKLHPVGTTVDIDWSETAYADKNFGKLTKDKNGKWRTKTGATATDPKIIAKAEAAAAE